MTEEQLNQSIAQKCREALASEEHKKPFQTSYVERCSEPGCKAFLPDNGLTIEEQDYLARQGWMCFTKWRNLRVNTASFSVVFRCPKHSERFNTARKRKTYVYAIAAHELRAHVESGALSEMQDLDEDQLDKLTEVFDQVADQLEAKSGDWKDRT